MRKSNRRPAGEQNAKPPKRSAKPQSKRRTKASTASTWFLKPARIAADAVTDAAKQIGKGLGTVGNEVLDLNRDGLVDQKDVRLLARKIQRAAEEVLKSEPVQSALKAAAVGSVVAIPIPLIGPAGGAATAVIFFFAYRGTKGIVRVVGAPFAGSVIGKSRSKKKTSSSRRARAAAKKT